MPERASSRILPRRADAEPAFPPEGTESDVEASAAEAEEEAYQRGLREGLAQGRAEAAREFEVELGAVRTRLGESLADLAGAAESVRRGQETRMIELAVLAGSRIARERIADDDPVAVRATREAIEALPGDGPLKIRMNPDDLESVREALGREVAQERIELVGDEAIERGGCVVESDHGTVNATVGAAEAAVREEAFG